MSRATAKNEIQVMLHEYLGNRKAAKVAEEISEVMQKESRHTHQEKTCYIHQNEDGTLVLTMESVVESWVKQILVSYLEENEVEECLNQIMGRTSVNSTTDTEFETINIDGSQSEVYTKLLKHVLVNAEETRFKNVLIKAINVGINSFKVPVNDPSIDESGKIQFVAGAKPAVGYSYNEIEKLAKESGLRPGTRYEYVLFLGTIIDKLISEEDWSEADAWNAVCTDSTKLGHYYNSVNAKKALEPTGSRKIAGKCDLANTCKILAKEEEADIFWIAGGNYYDEGDDFPLACLCFRNFYDGHYSNSVGWFVL